MLSGQSGVRAFVPVFILGLLSYLKPELLQLDPSMEWVKHPATISVTGVLATLEMVAE